MMFLTKSRERETDVAIEPEPLRTLRSFAIRDRLEVARGVSEGLPVRSEVAPQEAKNIDLSPLYDVGLLTRPDWDRAAKRGIVDACMAEMLLRYIRVYSLAVETFGHAHARTWLLLENRALGGAAPVSLLASEDGGRAVDTLLGRIGYGIAS